MKSYLALVLAVSAAVVLAADDDQKCMGDFQAFMGCVKTQYDSKPDTEKENAKKDRRAKADKCFADAGCDGPNWDDDPMGGAGKHFGKMGNMPDAVKQCLKKKLIEKVGAQLNECLDKKGVKNVNFTAFADSLSGSGLEMEGHADAKEGIQGGMKAKFNAVKAVDKCSQKKGGNTDSVKPLEKCLYQIQKDEKSQVCELTKPCEDKVKGECKKRGQDVRKALCQCKKEKEGEVAVKLRALGQQNSKVAIPDLVKTVASDQDMKGMIQQIDACYKETGNAEDPMFKLAMGLLANSGSGGGSALSARFSAAMSVNGSTVVIMADMMTLDAEDKSECEACH